MLTEVPFYRSIQNRARNIEKKKQEKDTHYYFQQYFYFRLNHYPFLLSLKTCNIQHVAKNTRSILSFPLFHSFRLRTLFRFLAVSVYVPANVLRKEKKNSSMFVTRF